MSSSAAVPCQCCCARSPTSVLLTTCQMYCSPLARQQAYCAGMPAPVCILHIYCSKHISCKHISCHICHNTLNNIYRGPHLAFPAAQGCPPLPHPVPAAAPEHHQTAPRLLHFPHCLLSFPGLVPSRLLLLTRLLLPLPVASSSAYVRGCLLLLLLQGVPPGATRATLTPELGHRILGACKQL